VDSARILKHKIHTIFIKILKSWKISENEPSQKRQRFSKLQSEELDSLLDAAQAQRTKYNTAYAVYLFTKVRYFNFPLTFVFEKNICRDVFTHVLVGTYHLEWAKEKNITKPLHQQSDEELNKNLKVFYAF
jgi:hypothetical protein